MIDKSISWEDYKQIQRMNPSTLVHGCKSMLRLKRAITQGFPERSDAMMLGTGIHALLLEPDEFEERFCVIPAFQFDIENVTGKGEPSQSRATSYCKAKEAAFVAAHKGKDFLDRSQYDTALMCIEALNSRKHFCNLVEGSNKEVTVLGEIEGVPFKGRLDLLSPRTICDLKTTYDVSQFNRTFTQLEYAFKLAIYRELVRQNTVGVRDVKVIAQETKDDFDNAMFSVPSELLDVTFNRVLQVTKLYKQSCERDEWLGWDRGEVEIEVELPFWARKQMEDVDWSGVEVGEQVEQESYY